MQPDVGRARPRGESRPPPSSRPEAGPGGETCPSLGVDPLCPGHVQNGRAVGRRRPTHAGSARQEAPAFTAFLTPLLSAFEISPADVLRVAKFTELDGSRNGSGSNIVEGSYDSAMPLGLSTPVTSATGKARGRNKLFVQPGGRVKFEV